MIASRTSGTAPELLTTADVLARYGLRDPRAARRLMDAAGAFVIGGRLMIRRDDLAAYELQLVEQRRATSRVEGEPRTPVRPRRTARGKRQARQPAEPLAPGWWRETDDDARGV